MRDKTEGVQTRLTVLSSAGARANSPQTRSNVPSYYTYLARGEHALNRDADRHHAQRGGPIIAEFGSAYLRKVKRGGTLKRYQEGTYVAVRVDVLWMGFQPMSLVRDGLNQG